MRAVPLQPQRGRRVRASRRLLALAGDERLVREVRDGSEAAFEVVYDRYGSPILSFCRHMLGSQEEAEEAVQHSFAAAWADLRRNDRPIRLKPWLFTIARNRCLSLLRARKETAAELEDVASTVGLVEEVSHRSDVRALLVDLRDLSEEQRAALVLSELGGLAHADIAEVLDRKEADVKALVFRARSTLADWREARETPCAEIREQLAVLRGGALRRRALSRHLQQCTGCQDFREHVKAQRRLMALVLPVVPSLGLRDSVLAAAGLTGGAAGGVAATGGGIGSAALGSLGGATAAKVAVVGVLVGGAATVGERALDRGEPAPTRRDAPVSAPRPNDGPSRSLAPVPAAGRPSTPPVVSRERAEPPAVRRGGQGSGRGSSQLAPPGTPVRAKGAPPALGRLRRGLEPPARGPKTGNGRAVGRERQAAAPPGQRGRKLGHPAPTAPPKKALPRPEPRGQAPKADKQAP